MLKRFVQPKNIRFSSCTNHIRTRHQFHTKTVFPTGTRLSTFPGARFQRVSTLTIFEERSVCNAVQELT